MRVVYDRTYVDLQWRRNSKTGEWLMYDVMQEGVSHITASQNEWADILRKGGVGELTQNLLVAAKQPL
ncbi:ABC transporter substrate-binding protein [Streptomyces sp. NPDC057939]|uniref:ABC transporter substrate-binding protein n=1 Tax=Streptomyces sp. NPDC057939 TaxID=3346284 RepID=UPI0036EC14E3